MAGFIIYKDTNGRPFKVKEFPTLQDAVAYRNETKPTEDVMILSAESREAFFTKRPGLLKFFEEPKIEHQKVEAEIRPDIRRTKMIKKKKEKV